MSLQQSTAAEQQQPADSGNAGPTRVAGALPTHFMQQAEPVQGIGGVRTQLFKSAVMQLHHVFAQGHSALNFSLAFGKRFDYFAARHTRLGHFA